MPQDMLSRSSWWVRRHWLAITGLTIIGLYLVIQHTTHVLTFLPFALLLLCPLMHVFMHGGHGNHGHQDHEHSHIPQRGGEL